MADKPQKHRPFFPGQMCTSEDQESNEIKQSKSNGCLKQGEMSLLRKHISMDKMTSKPPSRSRSKNTKAPVKVLNASSSKLKSVETGGETKVKISMRSIQSNGGQEIGIGSPLTPKKRALLTRNAGIGQ